MEYTLWHRTIAPGTELLPVVYIHSFRGNGEDVWKACCEAGCSPFVLVSVNNPGTGFDDELSPWPAEGVWKGQAPYKGLAAQHLRWLTEQCIPEVESRIAALTPAPSPSPAASATPAQAASSAPTSLPSDVPSNAPFAASVFPQAAPTLSTTQVTPPSSVPTDAPTATLTTKPYAVSVPSTSAIPTDAPAAVPPSASSATFPSPATGQTLLNGNNFPEHNGQHQNRPLQLLPIIAGYSLAGLFALWAAWNSDYFQRVASVSGSMWYPGFKEYIRNNFPRTDIQKAYFSLGDKESRTRHPLMGQVDTCTADIVAAVRLRCPDTAFEWNRGNHFDHPDLRMARAIAWLLH